MEQPELYPPNPREMEKYESYIPNPRDKKVFLSINPPDNPHWNAPGAVGMWLMSVAMIAIIPGIAVIGYALANNLDVRNGEIFAGLLRDDKSAILSSVIAIIPAHLITIFLCWLFITRSGKESFTEALGWKTDGFGIWQSVITVGLFFIFAAGLISVFGEREDDLQKILKSSKMAVFVIAFMATFTAPLVEEVIYRGIIYSAFFKNFGTTIAIISTTVLFAMVHFPQYWGNPASLITITAISFALTLVRSKTGNLLPCIILHTIFNGSQSLLLIADAVFDLSKAPEAQPASLLRLLSAQIF